MVFIKPPGATACRKCRCLRCLSETRSSAHPLIELLYVATVHGRVLLPAVGALNQAVMLLDALRELVEEHLHHGAAARVGQNHPASVTAPPVSAARIDSMRNLSSRTQPLTAYIFPGSYKPAASGANANKLV